MTHPPDTIPPAAANQVAIRAARPADAEAIAALLNLPGYRWGTLRLPYHTPEEVRAWMEKSAPGSLNLVATVGEQLVGNAGLDRFKGRRAHSGRIGMGVHDAWTGQGIGTALLGALVETADKWLGLRRLELTVYTDNAAGIALYQRFGFEVEGTHKAYAFRDGAYVDAHAMARLTCLRGG